MEKYSVPQVKCPSLIYKKEIPGICTCVERGGGTNFQENHSQGSLEEMVLCSPSQISFAVYAWKVPGTKFLQNPSNGGRDMYENVLFLCKCPSLLTEQNQTYVVYSTCMESAHFQVSGKSLTWKPRYRTKVPLSCMYITHHDLMIDTNMTEFVMHA
jgi:hypothetical protein